jgi:hypothetical protein
MDMYLIAICAVGFVVLIFGIFRIRQLRNRRELERYSIDADELHTLLESKKDIVVLDVRQPLDLLAHSEIIPGARRVPPKDVMEQAELIPKDKDSVIYCTCVSEKTSRMVLENALRVEREGLSGRGVYQALSPGHGELATETQRGHKSSDLTVRRSGRNEYR